MQYRTKESLAPIARLYGAQRRPSPLAMDRRERLMRWMTLLRDRPGRTLRTLIETEYQKAQDRDAMRCDGTAISVAYEDPKLRAAGLEGDTYGDAKRFFALSDEQLHDMLCYCHFGCGVSAGITANFLQHYIPQQEARPGIFRRALNFWRPSAAV